MRKFWAIAALNLLVLGGISANAVMAIAKGHAVSGIGAPDALTWGMAALGPVALVVIALLALRRRGAAGKAEAPRVDAAIAADLPGSVEVDADSKAMSRLNRFARSADAEAEEIAPDAALEPDASAFEPMSSASFTSEEDFVSAEQTPVEDEAVAQGEQDDLVSDGSSDEADVPDADGDDQWPPALSDDAAAPGADDYELTAMDEWHAAEETVNADEPEAPAPVPAEPAAVAEHEFDGLPVSRLQFTMPAERHAAQWDWVYRSGSHVLAPAAETGFPWATAGIAHVAGAITASRLLPVGSQAAAEARGWREAVAGFGRSELIDPADGEAFVGWINSLATGDDAALRAAIDGALDALKAEAGRDHALGACLPAQFGIAGDGGGEAGGIALAG
jgi:hypothetical protein